ncbi:MAG: molybdenum cofactor guanylyltransferase [Chloroflexota bacterium]
MTKTVCQPYSIAILAGGLSKRMGQNKALLPLGGTPVIQRILNALTPLSDDLFLVTNTPSTYHHLQQPMVSDIVPDKAALGGIYTALEHARYSWVFVCACDMPFIDDQVVQWLADSIQDRDAIVCPYNEDRYPEPLHSLYHKQCSTPIAQSMQAGQLKISHIFKQVVVHFVPYDRLLQIARSNNFFLNLNTPTDLEIARNLVRGQDKRDFA